MSVTMISRADDFGSAPSANAAILKGLEAGYWIRNVSCMAPGLYMERDAAELARYKGQVEFGLHFTVNSEWDSIKWVPCAPKQKIPTLLDESGNFYQSSQELQAAEPDLDELIRELDAQLDRLTALGVPVSYLDGHMFPERFVPGLDEQLRLWCRRKGLLCTNSAFGLWQGSPEFTAGAEAFLENTHTWLTTLAPDSTVLYVMHPAQHSPKTMLFANRDYPAGVVAHERELEAISVISPVWQQWVREQGIRLVPFSRAKLPE